MGSFVQKLFNTKIYHMKYLQFMVVVMCRPHELKFGVILKKFCVFWELLNIIGASRSEPHTNHSYKKIAVPVCMYVCM